MRLNLRSHATSLLLVAAGVVFAGQSVGLFLGAKTLSKVKSELAAKDRQLASLANSEPAPTQAAADGLARDLVELREAIGQAESRWRDHPISRAHSGIPPPPNSRAAYFDLVRYRQTLAGLAREQGVEIGQDEFWGFRAYANEGPDEVDIVSVHTQRLVLERVLESLLRSKPQRVLAVIREEQSAGTGALEVRESESADVSYRFQIRFRGTTVTLRTWLNELARDRAPVLVRGVTVEPGTERQIAPLRGRHNVAFSSDPFGEAEIEGGFEPLARPSASEFLVTLDYVELRTDKETEATSGETPRIPNPSPEWGPTWPEPEPQGRGPQWVFDVFTPPEIFYQPASQQFYVKAVPPPIGPSVLAANSLDESPREAPPAPRLLKVRRETYPLQLRGYIGGIEIDGFAGESVGLLLGLFENRENGETLLLRRGERVGELGIEVLDLRLESRPFADSETTTLRDLRAVATIRDSQGERRELYEGERAEGHKLVAQIEWGGECLELREGDVLVRQGGESLSVAEIQFTPEPRVVVRNHATATEFELLVLAVEPPPNDSMH